MTILDERIKATDMSLEAENYYIRAFLAGGSKSGKTTSAMSIPGRKLLIDVDGRKASVVGWKDLEIMPANFEKLQGQGWIRLDNIKKDLFRLSNAKTFPFDAIIFDGLTSMGRFAMRSALLLDPKRGLGGTPAEHHWFPQMFMLTNFIKDTLSLPCHIIYTGHLDLIEDKKAQSIQYLPKITGKLRTELGSWFDETYLCSRRRGKEGEYEYSWNTIGSGKYDFLGSSMNLLGEYWKSPFPVKPKTDLWGFGKLLSLRFKEGKDKELKGGEYRTGERIVPTKRAIIPATIKR